MYYNCAEPMEDALSAITKVISSPPGQMAAGGVLAGFVWKFFERVESVLNENSKLEIAVWLLGAKAPAKDERAMRLKLFHAVCGILTSPKRVFVITLVFLVNYIQSKLYLYPGRISNGLKQEAVIFLYSMFMGTIVFYSVFLIEEMLEKGVRRQSLAILLWLLLGAVLGGLITWFLYCNASFSAAFLTPRLPQVIFRLSILPCFLVPVWIWLPFVSGFLLKAARRFHVGFDWFNRRFDIEKKPLQSIGLVAGTLVAVMYWTAVIVSRVVG
uniref:Uncharacterized protein n=1 Tax=Solibacter usitatus (strain Ellin6076) TaxID=234267 RepID=Q01SW5_SOLUE